METWGGFGEKESLFGAREHFILWLLIIIIILH